MTQNYKKAVNYGRKKAPAAIKKWEVRFLTNYQTRFDRRNVIKQTDLIWMAQGLTFTRSNINGQVKSTKASYYVSSFIQSNGDSRKTWQLINELMSRQKNNESVKELELNENSLTSSHELSNEFNDHFSTIGTKLAK